MNSPIDDLPQDLDTLRRMVLEARALADLRAREIESLKLLIAKLRRAQFGRSSERLEREIEQLELQLEELETQAALIPAPVAMAPQQNEPVAPRALPAHLPRKEVVHKPACECPKCGQSLRQIGEDVSEMLDYVPARFRVIRHVRPKYVCTGCQNMVQASAASRPIERGMPGAGLLAHILVAKYADHLPLYRQAQIYEREGVSLDRSLMAQWVGRCFELVNPLAERIGTWVRNAEKVHADDTPLPVLDPGRGNTKTARLWTYVRDDRPAGGDAPPAVWFRYSPDRRSERPREHLAGFTGVLQADAYAGFNALYAGGTVREAACWAHARRGFYDLHQAHASPVAAEALARIGQLYAVESQIRGKPPDQRRQVRQTHAAPVLDALRQWLRDTLARTSKKSALATAIGYVLTRWTALTRYVDDGRIEIDNNAAERALRTVALGRKNFLFCGSDAGGERAAAIYSLVGTAKLNGIDPEAYLRLVIERIGDHPVNRLDELLPWAVADQVAGTSVEAQAA